MTWIILIGSAAAAWVMLATLSSERKARADRLEIQAAIERQRSAQKAALDRIPVLSAATPAVHPAPESPNPLN